MNINVIIVISTLVFLLLLWFVLGRKNLLNKQKSIHKQWNQINLLLSKRQDLLPNFLLTIKKHSPKQQKILQDTIAARALAARISKPTQKKIIAESEFQKSIKKNIDIGKIYPSLSKDTNFLEIRRQILAINKKILEEISNYNTLVRNYNKTLKSSIWLILAKILKSKPKTIFNI